MDGNQRAAMCCEGLIGVPDGSESSCGRPGAQVVMVGCVHEHLQETPFCDRCIERGIGCTDCYDLGHVCWMQVLSEMTHG